MGNSIWTVAECTDERLHEVSFEILGEGRKLAAAVQGELAAIIIGSKKAHLANTLFQYGADKVYVAEHPSLGDYATESYTQVLADLVQKYSPYVVVAGATPNGCDLIARVAARLDAELVTNCTSIRVRESNIEVNRPEYEGKVYRVILCSSPPPLMFSVKSGVLGKDTPRLSRQGELVHVEVALDADGVRTKSLGFQKASAKTLDVAESEVVVVGGAGVGRTENWRLVDELAELLGGCVGGTRMAMDAGRIDRERLVGQTGRSIGPKLCLELGVSGAVQHTAGMRDSKFTIAVNMDRGAPIFKVADTGVVADLNDLLPVLVRSLRHLKGSGKV